MAAPCRLNRLDTGVRRYDEALLGQMKFAVTPAQAGGIQ
jgi:hypothetical protein